MPPSLPERCRVVLVRVRNPLNIGASARAMANFGFHDLAVAGAYEPSWQEAKTAAVGGDPVLARARAFPSLREAVAGCSLVIGTTAGQRRSGDYTPVFIQDAAGRIRSEDRVALLFGSEKTGLSNEELSYCHRVATIPTSAQCPSMNLGQAVAVCCYELSRGAIPLPGRPRVKPAAMETIEKLREELLAVLATSGYRGAAGQPGDARKLRALLMRLQLSSRDVATLRGMVAQVAWKLAHERHLTTDEHG